MPVFKNLLAFFTLILINRHYSPPKKNEFPRFRTKFFRYADLAAYFACLIRSLRRFFLRLRRQDTKVTGEITVYAVWRELVTVSFNANGGLEASLPQPKRVEKDEKLGSNYPTEIPTYEGNTFLGWSTDPNAQAPDITADSVITRDTMLYAVWGR